MVSDLEPQKFHMLQVGDYFTWVFDEREIPHLFKKIAKRKVYDTMLGEEYGVTKEEKHAECFIGTKYYEKL